MEQLGAVARNQSKGCGTVMRVAPVGIVCAASACGAMWPAFELGVEVSKLTHGHPTGYLAGGFFAQLLAHLLAGLSLGEAVTEASVALSASEAGDELLAAVNGTLRLAHEGDPTPEKIESLGGGWVAEEAVAIALYIALGARDFESALRLAVNHGGDSDSTWRPRWRPSSARCAGRGRDPQKVAGGARSFGRSSSKLARDLARLRTGAFGDEGDRERYPGW